MNNFESLESDYARAKTAERELKWTRRIVWLLLKQIGEPVTLDATSLLEVPDDAELLRMYQPNKAGFVTLNAR